MSAARFLCLSFCLVWINSSVQKSLLEVIFQMKEHFHTFTHIYTSIYTLMDTGGIHARLNMKTQMHMKVNERRPLSTSCFLGREELDTCIGYFTNVLNSLFADIPAFIVRSFPPERPFHISSKQMLFPVLQNWLIQLYFAAGTHMLCICYFVGSPNMNRAYLFCRNLILFAVCCNGIKMNRNAWERGRRL